MEVRTYFIFQRYGRVFMQNPNKRILLGSSCSYVLKCYLLYCRETLYRRWVTLARGPNDSGSSLPMQSRDDEELTTLTRGIEQDCRIKQILGSSILWKEGRMLSANQTLKTKREEEAMHLHHATCCEYHDTASVDRFRVIETRQC